MHILLRDFLKSDFFGLHGVAFLFAHPSVEFTGHNLGNGSVSGPGCHCATDDVAVLISLARVAEHQSVGVGLVLHIEVVTILVDGCDGTGNLGIAALANGGDQGVDIGHLRNLNHTTAMNGDFGGCELRIATMSRHDADHIVSVFGSISSGGQGHGSVELVVTRHSSVGIHQVEVAVVDIAQSHIGEFEVMSPVCQSHHGSGAGFGRDGVVGLGRLESAERSLHFGAFVIGGLGSLESTGNHIAVYVGLSGVAKDAHVTGIVLDEHI